MGMACRIISRTETAMAVMTRGIFPIGLWPTRTATASTTSSNGCRAAVHSSAQPTTPISPSNCASSLRSSNPMNRPTQPRTCFPTPTKRPHNSPTLQMNKRPARLSFRPPSATSHPLLLAVLLLLLQGVLSPLFAIAVHFQLDNYTTCSSPQFLPVSFAGAGYNDGCNCNNGAAGTTINLDLEEGIVYSGSISAPSGITLTRVDVNVWSDTQCYFVSINGDTPGPNGYFLADGLNTTSYSFTVELFWPNIVVDWDSCSTDGANTLVADGQSHATPSINDPNATVLAWAIVSADHLGCTNDSSTGVVTAGTNSGTLTIRVVTTSGCYESDLQLVRPADSCCGGYGQAQGAVSANVASIDLKIGMGWALRGNSAGYMQILEDSPSAALATPQKLQYKFVRGEVEPIFNNGVLVQLNAPDGLANVVTDTTNKYHIDFYAPSNVVAKAGGISTYTWTGSP